MLLITGPNASGKSVYMKQASGPCYELHAWPALPEHVALLLGALVKAFLLQTSAVRVALYGTIAS
jgi:hypothetical protein